MWKKEEADAYLKNVEKAGSILGLTSIRSLMEELLNVQDSLAYIHVAGTNGKGSVCAMMQSILIEAGWKVGMYTSPAVFDYYERYQINGINIEAEVFTKLLYQVKEGCDRMLAKGDSQPTIFEVETAVAFLYFAQMQCDIVILETGMGGASDATNIIRKPLISILTSVSLDHMNFLGTTIEEIAKVKAGIIKEEIPVVTGVTQQKALEVIQETVKEKNACLIQTKIRKDSKVNFQNNRLCFTYEELGEIKLQMLGKYQIQNAACAIEAAKLLQGTPWKVTNEQIKKGIENTRWNGRFSILQEHPLIVLDGAHNEDAVKKLRETLEMGFTNHRIVYIIGVLADKEYEKMLRTMLPLAQRVFTVTPSSKRALNGAVLAETASRFHQNVTYVPNIKQALEQALLETIQEESMILAFGSLSYLGEIKTAFKEIDKDDR
ncbi:MAG: folylpolyglutamate synthase/dihydrofolate synthase family protein [Lachnospiraceae bacterium]